MTSNPARDYDIYMARCEQQWVEQRLESESRWYAQPPEAVVAALAASTEGLELLKQAVAGWHRKDELAAQRAWNDGLQMLISEDTQ